MIYLNLLKKVIFLLHIYIGYNLDPYNVHMQSLSDESINAVADILRSFFRQLEEPLIPKQFHDELYRICNFLIVLITNFFSRLYRLLHENKCISRNCL